jgi:hypothetical protein
MTGELTAVGQLIGTPRYMSPEQALGRADVDGRSDLYSLGIVGYEMISGRRPFDAESPMEALTLRLTRDPKPLGSAVSDLPSDLALAVDRCLQRDLTKRWSDAKSLREALLPPDEEHDDSLPGRMLRIGVTMGGIAALGLWFLLIYFALHPDFVLLRKGVAALVTVITMMFIMMGVATLGLRSHGIDGRSILMKAFQQPSWWRSWYPRTFRRRGDVWSRLPNELRRFRLYRGFFQMFLAGIFLPLQLVIFLSGQPVPATLNLVMWAIWFVGLALLLTERRRATKFVRAKVGSTAAEASAILTTPTWGVSTWRRAPISTLLNAQRGKPRHGIEAPDVRDSPVSERTTRL